MRSNFSDILADFIVNPQLNLTPRECDDVVLAYEDTMAVALAGWYEPVSEAVRDLYNGEEVKLLTGEGAISTEHAALIYATAGHALDYDDVHLTSITHPSVVLCSAIIALTTSRPELKARSISAYAVGLSVNIAIGRFLGFKHYERGWHSTSTLGAIAGAAAVAYLLNLDKNQVKNALALAVPRAGGLQANFGTMAKPLQAGYAASTSVQSGLLAEVGVTGSHDVFSGRGIFDLFQGEGVVDATEIEINKDVLSVSRKLYPCCYLTHRMIGAALSVRNDVGMRLDDIDYIEVYVPVGTMYPLHVKKPKIGLEGKFCGEYVTSLAILKGKVGLEDFSDHAITKSKEMSFMNKVLIKEDEKYGVMTNGISDGGVEIKVYYSNGEVVSGYSELYPGSPDSPANFNEIEEKFVDCLNAFNSKSNVKMDLESFRDAVSSKVGCKSQLE